MINLTEVAITLIIIMIGGKIQEQYQPDQLEIHLSDGGIKYVSINKKYSCPKSCKTQHYHETMISDTDSNKSNYEIYYDDSKEGLRLNNSNVINVFEIKREKKKNKKNSSIKKEELGVQNFINKFDL